MNNPERNAGWPQGLVLLLGSSLTIMGSVMVAPILPKLGAEFGPHHPSAPWLVPLVITGPALAIALAALVVGWLADRCGRKKLLIAATLMYAVTGALPALLDGLPEIVAARLLFGCAEAAVMTCCTTLIADYWSGESRLKYVNRQVVTIGLVGSLFFVVGGALGEHSWRTPFYLYLVPLCLLPFMVKVLWEPSRRQDTMDQPGTLGDRTRPLSLVIGYLLVFFGMVLSFIVPVQGPLILVGIGVQSSTLIGLSAGLGLLATLGGSLLWPSVRRAVGVAGCNAVLLLLMAGGLALLVTADTYRQVLAAVTLHGIGAGMLVPNSMAPVMNALSTAARARGIGGYTASLYLGQFASPLFVGVAAQHAGGLHQAIWLWAVLAIAVAALWLLTAWQRGTAARCAPPQA
ncbi:MFS transporter [Pseudomonas sp. S 311-6]|nr:MFS transporter [Pseudomonas sp. S 311-6]